MSTFGYAYVLFDDFWKRKLAEDQQQDQQQDEDRMDQRREACRLWAEKGPDIRIDWDGDRAPGLDLTDYDGQAPDSALFGVPRAEKLKQNKPEKCDGTT